MSKLYLKVSKSILNEFTDIIKGRKPDAIGTVRNGRKKTSDGWVLVKEQKQPKKVETVKPTKDKSNDRPSPDSKSRFSAVKEVPRSKITTDPETFQGRQSKYSEESVNKIVSEGFDKSNDPIVVWHDKNKNKYIVISGHSRFEASERLYKKGDKSLAKMPVKEFNGSKTDAANYAILESNRASTNEGFVSDVNAVKKMLKEGYNKTDMLKYVKPKSYLEKVINYTHLNPKGQFIEYLDSDSKASFPYLERNAEWVGILRNIHKDKLTNQHEKEIFDYFYKDKKGLMVKKGDFFNMVEKRVNNKNFKSNEPLNLKNIVSENPVTSSGNAVLKQHENDIIEFAKEIERKQDLMVQAIMTNKSDLSKQFEDQIIGLNKKVIDTKVKMAKLKNSMEKLNAQPQNDLFSKSVTTNLRNVIYEPTI